ncbi:MAG TPA: SPOR domain-containing protein [Candidatus Acidoferrum sp.]|nr:SPOR domain-containing protein [Candidatus Acidoferrum sp.]
MPMAQDFAKQRPSPQAKNKNARPARQGAPVSRLNWFISGFLFGILCVIGGYIALTQYQSRHSKTLEARASQAMPDKPPAFDFGFYHELANAEVAVKGSEKSGDKAPEKSADKAADSPAMPAPSSPPASTAPKAQPTANAAVATATSAEAAQNYLLQAGSFQDKQEADERRAKITLLNMPAEIVPGVVSGRTWYRVQVGPFAGRSNTDEARKQLSANNIDSIPLLMR